MISYKKYITLGTLLCRERKRVSSFRISFISAVDNARGKGSRITAGAGAEQGPKKGWIHPEEGARDQEAKKEAFKQVRTSRTEIHHYRSTNCN